MAEISYYWDGPVLGIPVGDNVYAPYSPSEYHGNWKILFSESDNEGIIDNYLNELEPSELGSEIYVDSGGALVGGWFYQNTNSIAFEIETPSSNPRIDRIVLRTSVIGQTVRLTKIAGTEGAVPAAPSLVQTATVWDIPIAQVQISTAGVLSGFEDERETARSPLMPQKGISLIEEKLFGSTGNRDSFSNIPQIYNHLVIRCGDAVARELGTIIAFDVMYMQINSGDKNADYQAVAGQNAAISAGGTADDSTFRLGLIPKTSTIPHIYRANIEITISNYKSNAYKNFIATCFGSYGNTTTSIPLNTSGAMILDENPITTISLFCNEPAYLYGNFSLYGIY